MGSAITQNFDTLSNTAGSTTNNLTITGWFLTESGGGARDNEQYAVDTGASTTGDMYSYGAAASTERALGQLRSGTLIPLFGACFTNNTGQTIASLDVAFTGEEWRLGTAGRTDQLNFEYSTNATDLVTGTWTNVAALNFVTPDTATTGAKNGNAAADRTALSSTITGLSIPNGATFWIRWNDTDATGADDGLAVDDFSITPFGAVVQPNLTINDVSLNEGNAGTTSFTYTVSLSAPAGAGGVTFDIATADNTATQPSDYTQKSLTNQTIPAGSSTYSFTVLVNGDTTPETNETFFVNVTNVTGATVTDGQGQGTIVNDDAAPNLTINDVSLNEGNAGTTTFTFTVSLSAPAPAGGMTFDIATANGTATQPGDYTQKTLTSQTIPAGSSTYTFDVLVNGDTTPELDETFFVNVTNITNAIGVDTQGQGTIVNDDLTFIHDVQGNGAATPIPGATVTVEGIVVANFQGTNKLSGFFLQEEDADADANPNTSEGIFIFCNTCPTAVAEGQRVKATGVVSEFNNMTEITASTAGSVVVTNPANNLAQVTPSTIDLPIVGVVDDFYEAREGMKVTFVDTLSVSEYFELARYGQIILYEGGRPRQFTEVNTPSVAGNAAQADNLTRRRVILDDDNNVQQWYLTTSTPAGPADGLQYVYYPRANGGFSVGTQGTDFFRGGDLVNGLTGVLHWSFAGQTGTDVWRIRPTAANPATFTVANPRPATPPSVGGAIKVSGMNLLNYFTTIDTTASNSTGPCGPGGTLDCRGADSVAELNRQRERASVVICTLNADVYGFAELENTTPSASINDLLGAVNARCGGTHPYAFVNTGGTLGTDAIRVQQIYRTGVVSPVGSPLSDLDPIHSRPPTAQTYDVVDATNPAFGQRFTVIVNHLKSKGSSAGLPGDTDIGDGAGASNATRTAQAARLLTWISSTVVPAAGDPDVVLLGDFNAYAKEDPITTIIAGGYTDLEAFFQGANAYSYLFDGQLGHLDYGFASASLLPQITGADAWHINADEVDLFDYNDEIRDSPGESTFEEKPDGSALAPPRVVFQAGTPYRASDHDPVLVGLFPVADLAITKTDGVTTAVPGGSVTYTITASNAGPSNVTGATVVDTFPAILTATWTCVGAGGGTCTAAGSGNINDTVNLPSGGSVTYTVSATISASATGTLSNTATVSSSVSDPTPGNNSATDTDTLTPQANLGITKTDGVTTATPGGSVTYTITASNAGPSNVTGATVADTFPAILTATWTCVGAGGGTCTAAGSGNINDTVNLPSGGSVTYTVSAAISASATGTLSNTATVSSSVTDPVPGNNSATDSDTLSPQANLAITKTDGVTSVTAGNPVTYTITASNAGPSNAPNSTVADTFPATLTGVTWSCVGAGGGTCPANGSGNINATVNLPSGGSVTFTATGTLSAAATGTLSNTATVAAAGGVNDPTPGNNSATDSDTILVPCTISCPANITTNTAPGLCTAVVNYTTPTGSGNCGTISCTPASGSTFNKGTTTVTCANSGGTPSCTFTVTVNDATPPSITCPTNISTNTTAGTCAATVTYTTPTANDNCSGATVACSPASGSTFAKGVTTVTCTATDASNLTASCTFTVTVVDNQAPTVVCPANISANTAAGTCAATVTYTTPTASDNCAGATVACSPASGSSFAKGVTTVTCTATDAANLTGTCTFTVTVVDNQAPTVTCPANITTNTAAGQCSAVVTYTTPTANDNCSGATVSCSPASGSTFAKGVTTVTCTATDAANLTGSCTFTVTVNDNQAPTITCPANQAAGTLGGAVIVNYPAPTASDNCSGVTTTCTPASGSSFPVGVTTVSCTAKDASNNMSQACTFTVTVTVNQFTPTPTVSLTDPLVCSGPGNIINGSFAVTNNSQVSQTGTITVNLPAGLVGLANSCAANVGSCTVSANSVVWMGTLTAGQTVSASYQAQAGDVAAGTQLCAQTTAVFGANTASVQACLTINCPPAGPGGVIPSAAETSDQKAGSVLIYNVYTSGTTSSNTQNTRINLTNVHSTLPAYVHLFFVAEGCSIADSYLCLTANQTASFLASDLDPGTTGYLVAVAVDALGCPRSFNYLIGDEYVKFASGHAANLGAQAFSALAGGLPACNGNSVTATLSFDGISYNRTPAVLALDNIGARADGNDTLLILNRIGGNLGIGASTLGTVFGLLYDDAENSLSFSVSGNCQLRNSLSNNFPRTTPRFESFIPAGRTGWLKVFNQTGAIGMTGAAINFNANASASAGAFNQGHNLHTLTLNNGMSYVIPVFPPSC
ncbi:MAG TPA: ExeM/NucH family extracellular endonuclease [Blastocatellia bacterium]|nr:ExeM/NucH family extracellular endonuclease [Blastocatellia bacterium]